MLATHGKEASRMAHLMRSLGVLLVLGAMVVYARDCRMSFNQWKHCEAVPGETALLGDYVNFNWNLSGLFSDVLYVDGKPAARLVKYDFHLTDDAITVESLDGTQKARYCGK
jgi:hypothetical protein